MTPAHLNLLLKHGFAVFPIVPNGKIPYPGTKGFKDASKDVQIVTRMFGQRAGANVAIATGAVSGIFVLDVDQHSDDADGSESLKALEAIHGPLPDTVEVLTPSGGRHLYFKHVEGLGNRAAVRPGLDVRAQAGYVLCPPSTISGNAYEWEASSHPDDVAIAEAPAWLIELLKAPVEPPANAPVAPGSTKSPTADKFTAGSRNDKLTREAGKLRAHGLEATALIMALRDINAKKCEPPLPDSEVVTIATSIAKRPERGKARDPKDAITELWTARYMLDKFGADLHYVKQFGGWFVWQDGVWVADGTMEVFRMAIDTIKAIREDGEKVGDFTKVKFAIGYETNARRKAVIDALATLPDIAVHYPEFDKDLNLLNCKNCTLVEE